MNERDPILQALRLRRYFEILPWPDDWGLRKIDGIWQLLPMREPVR